MHVLVVFCGKYLIARLVVAVKYVLTVSVVMTVTVAGGFAQTSAQTAEVARQPMSDTRSAATLITGGGRIVVQRNSPWRLEPGEYVYPGEVISTGDDGWGMFKVSDGSTFE